MFIVDSLASLGPFDSLQSTVRNLLSYRRLNQSYCDVSIKLPVRAKSPKKQSEGVRFRKFGT